MKPNKAVCVLLSSTLLFCGCYSYTSVSKDEPVLNDRDAWFHLKNGGVLEAKAGQYSRVDGGYQVTGTITRQDTLRLSSVTGVRKTVEPFAGVLRDAEITEVTAYQYNGTLTLVLILLPVASVVIFWTIIFPRMPLNG